MDVTSDIGWSRQLCAGVGHDCHVWVAKDWHYGSDFRYWFIRTIQHPYT
ncbi:10804_t:CDS:2, partial [Cetraspora pellucida]